MPRSAPRVRRGWPAIVAALTGLAATALGAAPVTASAAPAAEDSRTVTYRGYEVDVPADWRVVDLDEDPAACLRFDRPTVYVGTPGEQQDCPARVVGRTAGLVIEPLTEVAAERISPRTAVAQRDTGRAGAAHAATGAVSAGGTIEVAVEDAGVLVTAAHAPQAEDTVRTVLERARVTGDAEPAAVPAPRESMPRAAQAGPQPGDFLGLGFDACTAPSQSAMNAWRSASPFQAIGVYISGATRGCAQPNLTAGWVEAQTSAGWHLIPIDVGRQAPCTSYANRISTDPATARQQGVTAANASVASAASLGIPAGSTLYSDIEAYTPGGSCTTGVLNYLSGWTEGLHANGYLAGVYSSAASGIRDVANAHDNPAYTRVDHIWFAWWNGRADTDTGQYAPAEYWADHQRIHQFVGEVTETHGGVSINIDRNYLDVGAGTPPPASCGGVNLTFPSYPQLAAGASGPQVSAAQCLLKSAGVTMPDDMPTGEFDDATAEAVAAFQSGRGLAADGIVGRSTWTALLSAGATPMIQNGSSGEAVSRLQRALTAARGSTLAVDGQFGPNTEAAVRSYQSSRQLDADGIVGPQTWAALQSGR
ncbi:glycoside hydrolase domain-containing protein [Streptomyces johnsoniae]|uniref:DUF1906 domain-containing protein n=1 Tax=Streptomyces johnsoniae TaxID=3075532 RepID=A0ABU2SHK2_9ACTN|nr:glycoside hydrolase domain-containing protein [Streptomyces sp. DSM 41886]MDT0447359.1 DUF1906 domain-containing protein [Streptomyces sp. DSM 41886]